MVLSIADFLTNTNIPNYLIKVMVINGKKIPFGINGDGDKKTLTSMTNNYKRNNNITPDNEFYAYCVSLKDTDKPIYCFDVDCDANINDVIDTYPFLKDTYYTKGNTKGFHFYIEINDLEKYSNEVKIGNEYMPDIDLIRQKKNIWEKIDKKIQGKSIKEVKWDNVKQYFNTQKMNFETDRNTERETVSLFTPEQIDKLIDCLKIETAQNCDEWRIIGGILYNAYKADGLPYFIKFSRKSLIHSPTEQELTHYYNTVCSKYNRYTLRTLCYYAKRDNFELYRQIFYSQYKNCHNWTAYEWADYLKSTLQDKIAYNNKKWFICNNNIWLSAESPALILTPTMIDLISQNLRFAGMMEDKYQRDERIKQLSSQRNIIDKPNFHSQLNNYLKIHFADNDFDDKLFSHQEEFVFRNGILNMKTGEFNKNILPENYVCKDFMIDWDYDPTYNENNIQFIKDTLLKIYNNDNELLKYVLRCFAYALSGVRAENIFINQKGVRTGNGKSTMATTLQAILPTLVGVMPQFVLQKGFEKRHKYLISTSGKRIVFFEELPRDKHLDNTFIKDITGGISYDTEVLHSTTKKMKIYWTPFANTNFTPNFDGGSDLQRRYKEINCDNKFWKKDEYNELVKNGKATETDFVAIENIYQKLMECRNEFIHLFCSFYKDYLENGLQEPENVKEWAMDTLDANNELGDIINQHFEITKCDYDRLGKQQVVFRIGEKYIFKNVIDYLRQIGVIYKKDYKEKNVKGVFLRIKIKEEENTE